MRCKDLFCGLGYRNRSQENNDDTMITIQSSRPQTHKQIRSTRSSELREQHIKKKYNLNTSKRSGKGQVRSATPRSQDTQNNIEGDTTKPANHEVIKHDKTFKSKLSEQEGTQVISSEREQLPQTFTNEFNTIDHDKRRHNSTNLPDVTDQAKLLLLLTYSQDMESASSLQYYSRKTHSQINQMKELKNKAHKGLPTQLVPGTSLEKTGKCVSSPQLNRELIQGMTNQEIDELRCRELFKAGVAPRSVCTGFLREQENSSQQQRVSYGPTRLQKKSDGTTLEKTSSLYRNEGISGVNVKEKIKHYHKHSNDSNSKTGKTYPWHSKKTTNKQLGSTQKEIISTENEQNLSTVTMTASPDAAENTMSKKVSHGRKGEATVCGGLTGENLKDKSAGEFNNDVDLDSQHSKSLHRSTYHSIKSVEKPTEVITQNSSHIPDNTSQINKESSSYSKFMRDKKESSLSSNRNIDILSGSPQEGIGNMTTDQNVTLKTTTNCHPSSLDKTQEMGCSSYSGEATGKAVTRASAAEQENLNSQINQATNTSKVTADINQVVETHKTFLKQSNYLSGLKLASIARLPKECDAKTPEIETHLKSRSIITSAPDNISINTPHVKESTLKWQKETWRKSPNYKIQINNQYGSCQTSLSSSATEQSDLRKKKEPSLFSTSDEKQKIEYKEVADRTKRKIGNHTQQTVETTEDKLAEQFKSVVNISNDVSESLETKFTECTGGHSLSSGQKFKHNQVTDGEKENIEDNIGLARKEMKDKYSGEELKNEVNTNSNLTNSLEKHQRGKTTEKTNILPPANMECLQRKNETKMQLNQTNTNAIAHKGPHRKSERTKISLSSTINQDVQGQSGVNSTASDEVADRNIADDVEVTRKRTIEKSSDKPKNNINIDGNIPESNRTSNNQNISCQTSLSSSATEQSNLTKKKEPSLFSTSDEKQKTEYKEVAGRPKGKFEDYTEQTVQNKEDQLAEQFKNIVNISNDVFECSNAKLAEFTGRHSLSLEQKFKHNQARDGEKEDIEEDNIGLAQKEMKDKHSGEEFKDGVNINKNLTNSLEKNQSGEITENTNLLLLATVESSQIKNETKKQLKQTNTKTIVAKGTPQSHVKTVNVHKRPQRKNENTKIPLSSTINQDVQDQSGVNSTASEEVADRSRRNIVVDVKVTRKRTKEKSSEKPKNNTNVDEYIPEFTEKHQTTEGTEKQTEEATDLQLENNRDIVKEGKVEASAAQYDKANKARRVDNTKADVTQELFSSNMGSTHRESGTVSLISSPLNKQEATECIEVPCGTKRKVEDNFRSPRKKLKDKPDEDIQNIVNNDGYFSEFSEKLQTAATVHRQMEKVLEMQSNEDNNAKKATIDATRDIKKSTHLSDEPNSSTNIQLEAQGGKMSYLRTNYHCRQERGLDIFRALLNYTNYKGKIHIGDENPLRPEKVFLLVGGTGSGKTTWINGLFNYIHGIDWFDDYRVKLIEEGKPGEEQDQAESQTREVTSYTIHHKPWFRVPFSVTVIDTPGFGDTAGIQKDNEIIEKIRKFFTTQGQSGLDQIDAVGFVIQSSLARLTPIQRYVFNSILSLFGKDIADNIFLLLTFADGQKPQVVSGIKEAALPYKNMFKFNNSALYISSKDNTDAGDDNEGDRRVDHKFWKMGTTNYKKFMRTMETVEPKSLTLTKDVLMERRCLEAAIEDIHRNMKMTLIKLEQMETEKKVLRKYKAYIDRNQDFDYETLEPVVYKKKLEKGKLATNCTICKKTCHEGCVVAEKVGRCIQMHKEHCKVCPYKCHWTHHKADSFAYEVRKEKVIKTAEELKKKYEDAAGRKLTAEQIIKKCKIELDQLKAEAIRLTEEAKNCLNKLSEIALKPNPLSTTDYIDLMIQEEEFLAGPGWKESVRQLQQVKEQAKFMKQLQEQHLNDTSKVDSTMQMQDGLSITDRNYLSIPKCPDDPV